MSKLNEAEEEARRIQEIIDRCKSLSDVTEDIKKTATSMLEMLQALDEE